MTTIGKNRGLSRLANDDGYFTMVALDQRPPLIAAIAKARGIAPAEVTFADMLLAKRLLVQALGEDASSMLFDPNFAMPAAIDILPRKTGLIVTLEEHRVEETPEGRKSRAIDNWSVDKIRQIGGDGVKVLAWYRPDAGKEVNEHQKAFVRAIGEDCRRHDIPYVLELLVYPFLDSEEHTSDYVESPLPAASLPALDQSAPSRQVAGAFEELGTICRQTGIPWVMLSGGAAPEQFERVLAYSYAAGAQGFLAGRTIWLNAIETKFPDADATLSALNEEGRQRLVRLDGFTAEHAAPWSPAYEKNTARAEGDFARSYGVL